MKCLVVVSNIITYKNSCLIYPLHIGCIQTRSQLQKIRCGIVQMLGSEGFIIAIAAACQLLEVGGMHGLGLVELGFLLLYGLAFAELFFHLLCDVAFCVQK